MNFQKDAWEHSPFVLDDTFPLFSSSTSFFIPFTLQHFWWRDLKRNVAKKKLAFVVPSYLWFFLFPPTPPPVDVTPLQKIILWEESTLYENDLCYDVIKERLTM